MKITPVKPVVPPAKPGPRKPRPENPKPPKKGAAGVDGMKIIKRLNPFGPSSGVWSGPNSKELFDYSFSPSPSLIFYRQVDSSQVRRLMQANGIDFEVFKAWYRPNCGPPVRRSNGSKFFWLYQAEWVWDFAFQHGFGLYPGPRLDIDNRLVDEFGEPWVSR